MHDGFRPRLDDAATDRAGVEHVEHDRCGAQRLQLADLRGYHGGARDGVSRLHEPGSQTPPDDASRTGYEYARRWRTSMSRSGRRRGPGPDARCARYGVDQAEYDDECEAPVDSAASRS